MKKLLISYILMLVFSLGYAQKMAYVDTQYILKQMPQFQSSEQRLDSEVKRWQDQIVNQRSKIEKLRISFENEKILLTEDQQKNRLATIDSTEKVLNEFIDKKFGSKGESITLRYNLAKPLQDQIWNAINTVAAKDKYNIVFDKSSDLIMIFTDSKYDITDKVLKQLGVNDKNAEKKEKATSKDTKGSESKTIEVKGSDVEERSEEEVMDNKPKTGYGSKYKPKKETNKQSAKEEASSSGTNETTAPAEETNKPKTGYGSKYVPKKETKKTEVKAQKSTEKKEAVNTKTNEKATTEEAKKAEKDTQETSAGYGSKYTPKKKNEKTEIKEENKTSSEPEKETQATETSKPKTGYGSKYVPKKKTINNK